MSERPDVLIIGAGPAGLMAAESLVGAGRVMLVDAMPTMGRKFLMAGKSGLNLTKSENLDQFVQNYRGGTGNSAHPPAYLTAPQLDLGPEAVMAWSRGLGIEVFTGSTGRVFPVGRKASPLLRAWLARLSGGGIELRPRWRWTRFDGQFHFMTPEGDRTVAPRRTILALGGASWPRLGSDATWLSMLADANVRIAAFRPSNMGLRVNWSQPMHRHFGMAVKANRLSAGTLSSRGEWVISRHGMEGGGVYEIAAAINEGAALHIDLAPDLSADALEKHLQKQPAKLSLGNRLRRVTKDPVKLALLLEWAWPRPETDRDWAERIKSLHARYDGPMGLDRAISSAGGIMADALTDDLELRALPGIYAAGEMLDWDAPTGGYLLTACLATGRRAGCAARRALTQG